ncbi:MAG: HlyD family type I secretion periplasmic adaptor subunit [Rhodobacteraceae bacterium]|nr:MAG: HlyD family type I secretion periplasmic adaptor subunit [Paracoccaceae bacterium]
MARCAGAIMTVPAPYSAKRYLWLAGLALAVLFVGFGGWSVSAVIAGAVIAQGQLAIEDDRRIIQHPTGGVIEAIHVREGQHVQSGQLLIALEGAELRSELTMMEARKAEVQARRARIEAERDRNATITFPAELLALARDDPEITAEMEGQRRLLEARLATKAGLAAQLAQRKLQITAQIDGMTAQLTALERQRDLVAQEYQSQQLLLGLGLTQAARVMALERELARIEGEEGALRAERAGAAERAAETELQILSLEAQRREDAERELRETVALQTELAERLRALRREIDRLELRASVSGIVYGLQVRTAQAILRAAEPAMFIVPEESPLIITARVPPSQINQIFLGQQALIHISAVNTRAIRQIFAQVNHISADAFADTQTTEAYYRVELQFLPDSLAPLAHFRLLPGMPVEVFLQTETQRPIDYLTRPLSDYLLRAMRER